MKVIKSFRRLSLILTLFHGPSGDSDEFFCYCCELMPEKRKVVRDVAIVNFHFLCEIITIRYLSVGREREKIRIYDKFSGPRSSSSSTVNRRISTQHLTFQSIFHFRTFHSNRSMFPRFSSFVSFWMPTNRSRLLVSVQREFFTELDALAGRKRVLCELKLRELKVSSS